MNVSSLPDRSHIRREEPLLQLDIPVSEGKGRIKAQLLQYGNVKDARRAAAHAILRSTHRWAQWNDFIEVESAGELLDAMRAQVIRQLNTIVICNGFQFRDDIPDVDYIITKDDAARSVMRVAKPVITVKLLGRTHPSHTPSATDGVHIFIDGVEVSMKGFTGFGFQNDPPEGSDASAAMALVRALQLMGHVEVDCVESIRQEYDLSKQISQSTEDAALRSIGDANDKLSKLLEEDKERTTWANSPVRITLENCLNEMDKLKRILLNQREGERGTAV